MADLAVEAERLCTVVNFSALIMVKLFSDCFKSRITVASTVFILLLENFNCLIIGDFCMILRCDCKMTKFRSSNSLYYLPKKVLSFAITVVIDILLFNYGSLQKCVLTDTRGKFAQANRHDVMVVLQCSSDSCSQENFEKCWVSECQPWLILFKGLSCLRCWTWFIF